MRATPPHCRAHTGPPHRPCASGPSPSTGSPCVTFLIRLPEVPARRIRLTRGTRPTATRQTQGGNPLGHSSALSSSIAEFHLPWWSTAPGTCRVSTSEPLSNDFRQTFDVNHAAGLPRRCSAQGKTTRRHQPDPRDIPHGESSTAAHHARGDPSPRHTTPRYSIPAVWRAGPPQRDSPATPRQTPAGNSPPYGHSTAMQTKSRMNSAETTQITG